jgi:hypothetical protein
MERCAEMKVGLVVIAYNEERLVKPFLQHTPSWIDETLVLISTKPWQGPHDPLDQTADIAESMGATVIKGDWPAEHEQRMAGQRYFSEYDWVIVLDPDEFLTRTGWRALKQFMNEEESLFADAYVAWQQNTYWKRGYRIAPREDYKQIILVKPHVKFVDKRSVNTGYGAVPLRLHHMSWARTDAEVQSKILHRVPVRQLNPAWYDRVWKQWKPSMKDLHPLTPAVFKQAIPTQLPSDLEKLDIWPPMELEELDTV